MYKKLMAMMAFSCSLISHSQASQEEYEGKVLRILNVNQGTLSLLVDQSYVTQKDEIFVYNMAGAKSLIDLNLEKALEAFANMVSEDPSWQETFEWAKKEKHIKDVETLILSREAMRNIVAQELLENCGVAKLVNVTKITN